MTIGVRFALYMGPEAGSPVLRAPVHKVIVGAPALRLESSVVTARAIALPAVVPHRFVPTDSAVAVAYLDARHYRFEEAERLAHAWRRVVPERDDPLALFEDAVRRPARRLDVRLEEAIDALSMGSSVAHAASRAKLSESRLTHLMSERLGVSPRVLRPWLLMRNAIGDAVVNGASFTRAAHGAGFADAAHFSRTCRTSLGVTPTELMTSRVRIVLDGSIAFDRTPRIVGRAGEPNPVSAHSRKR